KPLVDVRSDQQDAGLEAGLAIDRNMASRLGISAQVVDDTLYDAFGQRQVSTSYTPINQYHVVMEVSPRFSERPEDLNYVQVGASTGVQVPLTSFAHLKPTRTFLAVRHTSQFPAVTISFNLRPGYA